MKWIELLKDYFGRKAGERLALAETDGTPLVQAGIARWVEDDPLTPVIQRGIETALNSFTRGLDAVINQTLKTFADAQQQSRKHAVPLIFGEGGAGSGGSGDPRKSFGDWCLGVARNDQNS